LHIDTANDDAVNIPAGQEDSAKGKSPATPPVLGAGGAEGSLMGGSPIGKNHSLVSVPELI